MEKLIPINHGENTLLELDAKPFGICNAFAQHYNAGPAMLHPELKTPARMGPVSVFKPCFHAKPSRGMLQLQFPPAHDSSPQIKSIPHFFTSSPNSMLLSSAQPHRKLIKQLIESSWNITSSGRVWWAGASRQTGMCIPGVCAELRCSGWPKKTPHLEAAISCSERYRAARIPGQASLLIPAGREQVAWKKIIIKRKPRNAREQDEAQGSWGAADR